MAAARERWSRQLLGSAPNEIEMVTAPCCVTLAAVLKLVWFMRSLLYALPLSTRSPARVEAGG